MAALCTLAAGSILVPHSSSSSSSSSRVLKHGVVELNGSSSASSSSSSSSSFSYFSPSVRQHRLSLAMIRCVSTSASVLQEDPAAVSHLFMVGKSANVSAAAEEDEDDEAGEEASGGSAAGLVLKASPRPFAPPPQRREAGPSLPPPRPTLSPPAAGSAWRKGDNLLPSRNQKLVLEKDVANGRETSAGGAINTTPAWRTPLPQSTPAVKLTLKLPGSSGLSQEKLAPRKGPILRDVGAVRTPSKPSSKDPSVRKPGNPPDASSMAVSMPAKFGGKPTIPKGRDDRRKKSGGTELMQGGPKRKVGTVAAKGKGDESYRAGGISQRGGRKMSKASRKAARVEAARAAAPVKVDILEVGKGGVSVRDLAGYLAVNDSEVIKTLFIKGVLANVNQILDEDTVKLVCKEFNVEVIEAEGRKTEDMAKKEEVLDEEDLDHLVMRPPVVTIMGHVDHGKTSLLDCIRKSKVAAGEAGGITQGIGAYRVLVPVDDELQPCVFLDTPGHEAFGAMRARGASVTDVAIIVVAADDGVRPQTQESIAHARAAKVPIVVAINKVDKDGAEPERVMQELSALGLLAEEWGGEVPMVKVSALKGENIDSLLETVMLVAEFQDLKANQDREAKGTVIEASLDKTKGAIATLLVQNGTLRKGDIVLCGQAYGKVRAMLDDTGARVEEAGPSTAVQVIGLSNVLQAGDKFEVLDSLEEARRKAEETAENMRSARLAAQASEGKVTLSSLASSVAESMENGAERHQLNIVLKVDVQGSVEAIREALQILPQDTVNLRFLMQAPGDINVSDVDLAIASEAIIVGFNVGEQPGAQTYADSKGVEIRTYKVIYDLIDDMRNAMEGLLEPVEEQVPIGKAEVRATFTSGSGKVAGCMVTDGKITKGCGIRVLRGRNVVHTGSLSSLRRVKEFAKEVGAGLECGIGVDSFDDWLEGDIVEAFDLVSKKQTLEDASVSTAAVVAAVSASGGKSS